jgi:Cdc6-like AAA superfamily ATPase
MYQTASNKSTKAKIQQLQVLTDVKEYVIIFKRYTIKQLYSIIHQK